MTRPNGHSRYVPNPPVKTWSALVIWSSTLTTLGEAKAETKSEKLSFIFSIFDVSLKFTEKRKFFKAADNFLKNINSWFIEVNISSKNIYSAILLIADELRGKNRSKEPFVDFFECDMDWDGTLKPPRMAPSVVETVLNVQSLDSRLNIRLVTDETVLNILLNYFIEKSIRFIWFRVQYPLEESKDMKFSNKWWFCLHVIGQLIM